MLAQKLLSRTVRSGLLGGMAAILMTLPANAGGYKDEPVDEGRKLELSANVALGTEYVFRGISQTAEHATIQGGFDATYGMLYAGVWAANLDFGSAPANCAGSGDCADIELDVYAGITPSFGPVDLDLGVIGYLYPDASDNGAELDYVEFKFGASVKPVDMVTLGGTVYYSPEYTGELGEVTTLEGKIEVELPKLGPISPSFSALIGTSIGDDVAFQAVFGDDDYAYWNAGLSFGFAEKFSLDVRYWDSDLAKAACNGAIFQCDERVVATISASF